MCYISEVYVLFYLRASLYLFYPITRKINTCSKKRGLLCVLFWIAIVASLVSNLPAAAPPRCLYGSSKFSKCIRLSQLWMTIFDIMQINNYYFILNEF